MVTKNTHGYEVAYVRIRQVRRPQLGDKVASRSAQKSTIGLILPEVDMPFTAGRKDPETGEIIGGGIRPDIILNPHAIPSRMTIGKLIEIVASKLGALSGERINASAFKNFDIEGMKRNLKMYGFQEYGEETMYNGMTGKPFPSQIFIGPCYYQALRHQIADKIQMRGYGQVESDTRQPRGGRKNRGGLRFGEMERDALISHGASNLVKERLCISSDAFTMTYCKNCANIAIHDMEGTGFACNTCGDKGQFGKCTTPYSFKLFQQLLSAVHINVKLNFEFK